MPQIFKRTTNAISRLTIFGSVFVVIAVSWGWASVVYSPYVTGERIPLDQPVPFSHAHHVG
ncbi:MAG TPA: cytochrome C, partial [Terriglobia bacterium]|nr:cytochrome C [Terriglobia bacterium]